MYSVKPFLTSQTLQKQIIMYHQVSVEFENLNYKVNWIKTMPNKVKWGFENSDSRGFSSMQTQVFLLSLLQCVWSHGHSFILWRDILYCSCSLSYPLAM